MGYIFGEIDFSVVRCYNSFSGILSSELGLGKEEPIINLLEKTESSWGSVITHSSLDLAGKKAKGVHISS